MHTNYLYLFLLDILYNFSEQFIKNLISQKNSNSKHQYIRDLTEKYKNIENKNDITFYIELLEDIIEKFSSSDFDKMKYYHKEASISTGINVGFISHYNDDFRQDCLYNVFEEMFIYLIGKQNKEIKLKIIENECRQTIFSVYKVRMFIYY